MAQAETAGPTAAEEQPVDKLVPTPTNADVAPAAPIDARSSEIEFNGFVAKAEAVLNAFDNASNTSLIVAGVCAALGLAIMLGLATLAPGGAIWQWFVVIALVVVAQQATLFVLTSRAVTDQARALMMDEKEIIGIRVYTLEHSPYFDPAYREKMREAASQAADKLPLIERFNHVAEDYKNHTWYANRAAKSGGLAIGIGVLVLVVATLWSRRQIRA